MSAMMAQMERLSAGGNAAAGPSVVTGREPVMITWQDAVRASSPAPGQSDGAQGGVGVQWRDPSQGLMVLPSGGGYHYPSYPYHPDGGGVYTVGTGDHRREVRGLNANVRIILLGSRTPEG